MNLSQVPPQGTLTPIREVRKTDLQLVLDVWHGDLFDFLESEYKNSTKVVRVNEDFLNAVIRDEDWTFTFPDTNVDNYDDLWDGNIKDWVDKGLPVVKGETLSAKVIYNKLLESNAFVLEDIIATTPVNVGDRRSTIASGLADMWDYMIDGKQVSVILSTLRPRYSYVRGVNGRSSGAYSWGQLYDKGNYVFANGFGAVGVGEIMSVGCQLTLQGGSRRGALMLILNDKHTDIKKFITCKQTDGVITGANLSVGVSEEFMAARAKGEHWELGFPVGADKLVFNGDFQKWEKSGGYLNVSEVILAEELWDEMMQSAWKSAEPGVVFLGRYNEMSNSNYFNPIIATNPCGKQRLN
jgi:ribonucleoside-diphosphate reductase alpha chain